MFCPTCGRENPNERKFCSSCGTNLEAVSQVLSGPTTNFFTKLDIGLDLLMARYAEHIFKDASSNAVDRKLSNSWKLLGKGALTSFFDVFLAILIWNVMTVRFQILLISTPFRLLSERSARQKRISERLDQETTNKLAEPPERKWLPGQVPSVSEHTTERLQGFYSPRKGEPPAEDDRNR